MSLESQKSVLAALKPRNKKLAVALGLILGSTAMSINQMGCGIDARGTGEFAGAGGEGGMDSGSGPDAIFPVEDASTEKDSGNFPDAKPDVDAGMDADAGKDADVMMDASVDASPDADASVDAGPDVDASVDASVDAGPDADVDAGVDASVDAGPDADVDASVDAGPVCVDIPVQFKNIAEYVVIVYRGGCGPTNRAFTSYADGSATFNTGTLDLCLKAGDIPMIQVKDGTDKNSLEFESGVAPTEVQLKKVPSGTPVSYAEMDALCASTTDYSLVSDVNPAATGFKYEGNSVIDPTDAFRPKF